MFVSFFHDKYLKILGEQEFSFIIWEISSILNNLVVPIEKVFTLC